MSGWDLRNNLVADLEVKGSGASRWAFPKGLWERGWMNEDG